MSCCAAYTGLRQPRHLPGDQTHTPYARAQLSLFPPSPHPAAHDQTAARRSAEAQVRHDSNNIRSLPNRDLRDYPACRLPCTSRLRINFFAQCALRASTSEHPSTRSAICVPARKAPGLQPLDAARYRAPRFLRGAGLITQLPFPLEEGKRKRRASQSPYIFCLISRRCCASSESVAVGRASNRGMPIGSPVSSQYP